MTTAGRPVASERLVSIPARLSPADALACTTLAHREGMTPSQFVRRAVRREIERAQSAGKE